MPNIFYFIRAIFFLIFVLTEYEKILGQCNPPPAETCEEASLFCSLDEMNGYSCSTTSTTLGTCRPGCAFGGGVGYRTWWAFVSQGGNASITLSVGNCVGWPFLILGIWGDCNCGEEILCPQATYVPSNGSMTYQVSLKPCKIYYLMLDGGFPHGPCDFTLSTSGGGPPNLDPLGFINNVASGVIEPVCEGECDFPFHVNPQKGDCLNADYKWTLDGIEVGGNSNDIKLDFPNVGDFILCVEAQITNPQNGSICTKVGPVCATVKVRRLPDKTGIPRTICYEAATQGGYKWHSQYVQNSGLYKEEFKINNCCKYDSAVQFNVLPEPIPPDVYYITCDKRPYIDILGYKWFPCINHLVVNLPKTSEPFKCDSSIRLTAVKVDFSPQWKAKCVAGKVELSPNIIIVSPCDAGESYQFDYRWYKKTDTLQKTISIDESLLVDAVNDDYCVEVNVRTNLGTTFAICTKTFCDTISEANSKGTNEDIVISFCDSAIVNGKTYTQSDIFTQHLKNVFGCDSIVNTEIKIQKRSQTDINQTACDSVVVNNISYKQTGKYIQVLQNTNQCDSILNLDIRIQSSIQTDISQTTCDSIVVNNISYKQSGIYKQVLQSVIGCDSILNLDISIQSSSQTDINRTDCDSVVVNGQVYKVSGDYTQTYQNVIGCDSILNIHVNIPNSNVSPLVLSKCDSITINNIHYTQSGNYTQLLTSANGCDSTLTIDLTIGKSNIANYSFSSCDSASINGQWYLQSGNYTQLLQNANQCDSTLNINLNITKSTSGDTVFRSCDSVKINGITYNQTGIYKQTLTNSNQCDSTLIIDFTRLSKTSTALSLRSCDSLVINNQVYKQSGSYTQLFVNANQCDSILSLNVEILSSSQADISQTGCDSVLINGQRYVQSGNYSQQLLNAAQCDSTLNIDLTIYKSSSMNYVSNSCDSVNINGQIYKQSGSYTQYLKDVHLCDSTLNLDIRIQKSSEADISQTVCDSVVINGITYYQSGNYSQLLINSNACDSTLYLDLIIKPGNPSTLKAGVDTSICDGEIIQLNGIFSGQANFIWQSSSGSFDNPNNLTTNYYPNTIGDERIFLSAADDCKQWLDSLAVHVLPRQIVQVTGDTIIDPCNEITFTASGGTNYIWTPSSLIDCLDPPCSKVKLNSFADTRFTITTAGPCVVPANLNLSLSQTQSDIYLPNAFSPNGDNINDFFLPIFNCEQVDYYNLQIFDRWGNLLFESQNKDKGWNGKYQEVNMNPGVYPYLIQYELHNVGKKIKAGEITLVR